MATYEELFHIISFQIDGSLDLRNKVGVAMLIAADTILNNNDASDPPWATGNHAQRVKWANSVIGLDGHELTRTFQAIIGGNAGFTQAQILNASDSAIQNAVNNVVDELSANL